MTIITGFATGYVCRRLAGCNITVVTRLAASNDLRMIHHDRRYPEIYTVAILANSCCLDVRRILAGRIVAVVAIGTIAGDICVIEGCRRPADGRVAIITVIATGKVCWVLTRRGNAVVT